METNNATPNTMQLPLLDLANGVSVKRELDKALRKEENRIEFLMRKVRTLHEELNQALYTAKVKDKPVINSPADAYAILQPFMGSLQHEELWVVLLKTSNDVLELVRLYKGQYQFISSQGRRSVPGCNCSWWGKCRSNSTQPSIECLNP